VKNGRAHNILKPTAHKRKRRDEIEEEKAEENRQDLVKKAYMELAGSLRAQGVDIREVPTLLRQNQEMVHYLKAHDAIDERGCLKP